MSKSALDALVHIFSFISQLALFPISFLRGGRKKVDTIESRLNCLVFERGKKLPRPAVFLRTFREIADEIGKSGTVRI